MCIIELNVGADLIEISKGNKSGRLMKFLNLGDNARNQKDLIISLASCLCKSNYNFVGIEIKYVFSKRNKRFEIVFSSDSAINIVKISKQKKFDKDAIELDSLISDIINKHNIFIKGIIVLIDDFSSTTIKSFTNSLKNNITFLSYDNFKNKYGISN